MALAGFCVFQTLYEFVIGLHDCMLMLADEREFFEELMSRSADYYVELVKRAIDVGVDFFYPADDFAFKTGMLVHPKLFAQIWRPHFDRILAPIREAGLPIMFHSDGKVDAAGVSDFAAHSILFGGLSLCVFLAMWATWAAIR